MPEVYAACGNNLASLSLKSLKCGVSISLGGLKLSAYILGQLNSPVNAVLFIEKDEKES